MTTNPVCHFTKDDSSPEEHYGARLLAEIQKLTECCICFSDEYVHMKQLICQHTCCTSCLELLMRHKMRVEVHCPICRAKTVMPQGNANRLPDSLAYRQLKDMHTKYMAEYLQSVNRHSDAVADDLGVVSDSESVDKANAEELQRSHLQQLETDLTEAMSQLSKDFEECEAAKTAWMKAHWGSEEYTAVLQRYRLADTQCSAGRRKAASLQMRVDKLLQQKDA